MAIDSDDVKYVKKTKVVHYGSLEANERARLASGQPSGSTSSFPGPNGIQLSTASGSNINIAPNRYLDAGAEPSNFMTVDKQNALEEFERRRKAKQIAVSTDDVVVRAHLRQLNQPICCFGEGPADRRERLRGLLAKYGESALKKGKDEDWKPSEDGKEVRFCVIFL